MNSVHPLHTVFKTQFNLAFRPCVGLQSGLCPSVLLPKPYAFFSFPLRSTFLAHLILVDLITLKSLARYTIHEPPVHNFLRPPVPSSLLGPNTLLNPVYSETHRHHSSLTLRHTVTILPLLWDTPSPFFPYSETHRHHSSLTLRHTTFLSHAERQASCKERTVETVGIQLGLYILCQQCCVLKHDAVCLAVDGRCFPQNPAPAVVQGRSVLLPLFAAIH